MNFKIGILTIGSLYWEIEKQQGNIHTRDDWRKNRFEINSLSVKVPIRYGRKSRKRENTYTMVFSPNLEKEKHFGYAKVLQCINPISKPDDLFEEAQNLWVAEDNIKTQNENATGNLFKSWGCVALLINPNKEKLHQEEMKELRTKWANYWADKINKNEIKVDFLEKLFISKEGILKITWPKTTDGTTDLELDLLLATSTLPEPSHTSPEIIAQAWKDNIDQAYYFWRNQESGITTFQDEAIKVALK